MKKYLSIIIGLVIGVSISVGMIYAKEERVAHGDINAWDKLVAGAQNLKWEDIFGTSKGKNVYVLVRDKLLDKPTRDAKKEIGKMFGLTLQEVENVLNGSLAPILNNPKLGSGKTITNEDAALAATQMQNQFALLLEIYTLQQEIDTSIAPSEIFSNGDTMDSGFDLIYDLSVIEEILFLEKSKNLVGDPFDKQMDEPTLPTEPSYLEEPYVASGLPGATLGRDVKGLTVDEDGDGSIEVGDEDVDVNILDGDVCPTDDDLSDVLGDYDDEYGDDGTGNGGSGGDDDGGDDDDDNGDDDGDDDDDGGDDEEGVEAAEPGDYKKFFCPNITSAPSTGAYGDAGFSSLGGVTSDVLNAAVGGGAAFNEGGLAAYINVCLEISFKKKTYVSYNPGESCVKCEVNKIVENMNKTLSHSMVPNKATGNLMEVPKCKKTGTLLNFQFIAMAVPIPSPPNDEILGLNNTHNEWKKFVDRYKPFLGYDVEAELQDEYKLQFAETGADQASSFSDIQKTKSSRESEAKQEIENVKAAKLGENTALFVQKILTEMNLMNNFFDGYKTLYEKMDKELNELLKKETK